MKLLGWLRRLKNRQAKLCHPAPMPVLPPHLEGLAMNFLIDVDCFVNPDGSLRTVLFRDGDGRLFPAVKETVQQWRWKTSPARTPKGLVARLRFVWDNGKASLRSHMEFPITLDSREGDKLQLRVERSGVDAWLQAVAGVGWTGWNRVLLKLNADGTVAEAGLVEGSGAIGQAALNAARRWKFAECESLPSEVTLSLASADGRPMVRFGVAGARISPREAHSAR